MVSEAKKYKIRLILSLINNWDAYGGKPQYVKWAKDAGLNLTSDDDFFSHPTPRSYYKAHVKASSFLLFSFWFMVELFHPALSNIDVSSDFLFF